MALFGNLFSPEKWQGEWKRFAGDFRIVEETDARGRQRKRAVYTGLWTVLRDGDKARWKLIVALLTALLLAVVYGRAQLLTHTAGKSLLVMVPLLIGLFPCLYLLMGVFDLPFRCRPMRRDQYMHSFIRASRSAVGIGAAVLLSLLGNTIFRATEGNWRFYSGDWDFLLSCFAVLLLAVGIVVLLRSVEVTERENEAFDGRIK